MKTLAVIHDGYKEAVSASGIPLYSLPVILVSMVDVEKQSGKHERYLRGNMETKNLRIAKKFAVCEKRGFYFGIFSN